MRVGAFVTRNLFCQVNNLGGVRFGFLVLVILRGYFHAEHAHERGDGFAHVAHRRHVGQRKRFVGNFGVGKADQVEHFAQGTRSVEIVVHGKHVLHARGLRRLQQLFRVKRAGHVLRVFHLPIKVAHGVFNARQRRLRLVKAFLGEVERAAVVRLQHQETQHVRRRGFQDVAQKQEVAQRLAHFLVVDLQHAAVHPVVCKRAAARGLGLRALVFVMREHQVSAAAVNVERQA